MKQKKQLLFINTKTQQMEGFEGDDLLFSYPISTGEKGVGEQVNSECTPRGWHKIHSIIGLDNQNNSVFVARVWTGEVYSEALAALYPDRDWILTRILRLEGMEPGRNKGGDVDTFNRYIYIHGTPDSTSLGKPGSHGCVRVRNENCIKLALWAKTGTLVYIK